MLPNKMVQLCGILPYWIYSYIKRGIPAKIENYWGLSKMAASQQTTLANTLIGTEIILFFIFVLTLLKFVPTADVQLITRNHWFGQCLSIRGLLSTIFKCHSGWLPFLRGPRLVSRTHIVHQASQNITRKSDTLKLTAVFMVVFYLNGTIVRIWSFNYQGHTWV